MAEGAFGWVHGALQGGTWSATAGKRTAGPSAWPGRIQGRRHLGTEIVAAISKKPVNPSAGVSSQFAARGVLYLPHGNSIWFGDHAEQTVLATAFPPPPSPKTAQPSAPIFS